MGLSITYLSEGQVAQATHVGITNAPSLRADIPAGRMKQFLQTLYLCGLAYSSYGLPRCGIRSLLSQKKKKKRKETLSTVALNACKNSS